MTSVPVDQIRAQRAAIDPARVFLTLLAVLFFVPGWVARKVVLACWWAISYASAAVMVGWRAAAPRDEGGG